MARIFISHVVEDKPWLFGLVHWLRQLGHDLFIDQPLKVGLDVESGIKISEPWYDRLDVELKRVDFVLSIWSETARKKLARGGGKMFAKEVSYGALNDKLLIGVIDQPSFPSLKKDEAFLLSDATPDFDPLLKKIRLDQKYGAEGDSIADYIANRQFFAIEGLRRKKKKAASDDGLKRLQREALSPKVKPAVIEALDPALLKPALARIDRRDQVQRLRGLLTTAQMGQHTAAAIHASLDCEPDYVLKRLSGSDHHVDWRHGVSADPDQRRRDYLLQVDAVLAEPRRQAAEGASPGSLILYAKRHFMGSDPAQRAQATEILKEWSGAVRLVPPTPGLSVLFCMLFEDADFLDHPTPLSLTNDDTYLALGRINSADMILWCRDTALDRCLASLRLSQIMGADGFPVLARDWIEDHLRDRVPASLSMRDAIRLAQKSILAAHHSATATEPVVAAPAGREIHTTAFGDI